MTCQATRQAGCCNVQSSRQAAVVSLNLQSSSVHFPSLSKAGCQYALS